MKKIRDVGRMWKRGQVQMKVLKKEKVTKVSVETYESKTLMYYFNVEHNGVTLFKSVQRFSI